MCNRNINVIQSNDSFPTIHRFQTKTVISNRVNYQSRSHTYQILYYGNTRATIPREISLLYLIKWDLASHRVFHTWVIFTVRFRAKRPNWCGRVILNSWFAAGVSTRYRSIPQSNVNVMSSRLLRTKVVSLSKLSWRSVMNVGSYGMPRVEFRDLTLFQLRCWLITPDKLLYTCTHIHTYTLTHRERRERERGRGYLHNKIDKIIDTDWRLHLNFRANICSRLHNAILIFNQFISFYRSTQNNYIWFYTVLYKSNYNKICITFAQMLLTRNVCKKKRFKSLCSGNTQKNINVNKTSMDTYQCIDVLSISLVFFSLLIR